MRLFVALEVLGTVRAEIAAAVASARQRYADLRWVDGDGLHLTLAYLGSVDAAPDDVAAVVAPAAAVAGPIALRLTDAGRFDGRVLWVGVDDDPAGAVAALGADAQGRIAAAGLPVDRKPVRPHLTVARSRTPRGVTREVVAALAPVSSGWVAREVAVVALLPAGHGVPNRYEAMASLVLGSSTTS